ncbi:MAG TPA: hypothetical protein VIR81_02245 [Myxococcales bacterium]
MGALRDYLTRTLDDEGRARLKLLSPLGVMQRLILRYTEEAAKRESLLDEDARTVANIEAQLTAHTDDMRESFDQRLRAIQAIILEMRARGDRFFDDTVRLGRVPDLLRRERVRAEFERQVVGETPAEIEAAVRDLIDWMVEREHRLWQSVNDYLARRRQSSASALGTPGGGDEEHVIGGIGAGFDFNRRSVLQRVATASERAVRSYDREEEASQLASSLRGAVVATAGAGAVAVGLGVGTAIVIGTAAADITGITAAVVIATLGLGLLPLQRHRAKAQFDERTRKLSDQLTTTLREQFERELEAASQRLREALAPYTRFVRIERERVTETRATLDRLAGETDALRQRIERQPRATRTEPADSAVGLPVPDAPPAPAPV